MSVEIQAKVSLVNGRYARNANAEFIRCEKLTPGCTVRGCPGIPNPESYREVYRIKKDHWDEWKKGKKKGRKKRGYCFVEINHGMGGPGGTQKSVRALIAAASYGIFGPPRNFKIIYEPVNGGAL